MTGAWSGGKADEMLREAVAELLKQSEGQQGALEKMGRNAGYIADDVQRLGLIVAKLAEDVAALKGDVSGLKAYEHDKLHGLRRIYAALEEGHEVQAERYAELEARIVALEAVKK